MGTCRNVQIGTPSHTIPSKPRPRGSLREAAETSPTGFAARSHRTSPTGFAARSRQNVANGTTTPTVTLDAGRTYRIRLININPNIPLRFASMRDTLPVQWKAVAKDGADLPPHKATLRPAAQLIGVGEAYDFELAPAAPDVAPNRTRPLRAGQACRRGAHSLKQTRCPPHRACCPPCHRAPTMKYALG
jgi:FtsP/CotA-like multicopper oxidase with cupredoxin domain